MSESMIEPEEVFCRVCELMMHIPDGLEPTDICNLCAQTEVVRLTTEVAQLRAELAACREDAERYRKALERISDAYWDGSDYRRYASDTLFPEVDEEGT